MLKSLERHRIESYAGHGPVFQEKGFIGSEENIAGKADVDFCDLTVGIDGTVQD